MLPNLSETARDLLGGTKGPRGPRAGDGDAKTSSDSPGPGVVPAMDRRTGPIRLAGAVLGQPGPTRSKRARPNGDGTWTVPKSGSSSPASIRRFRHFDDRGDPQHGAHGGRGDGTPASDACCRGDLQGREEPPGPSRAGRDPIRRPDANAEGTDRARVVDATRWRRRRQPSSSPGPTRSSC